MHELGLQHSSPALRSGRPISSVANTRLAGLKFLSTDECRVLENTELFSRTMRAGEELVREAEPASTIHFLAEGWACRFKVTRNGHRQISTLLVANDVCNLDGLLFGRLDYGVRMLTAGKVWSLPRERALELAEYPGIARSFTWLGFVENAMLAQWALCLGRQSARERVAHLFCELSVRVGSTDDEGVVSFDLPLTQEHIADVLGLTPVHVNRTLQQLRTEGLLTSTMRTIAIPDIAELRRVADFTPFYLHVRDANNDPDTLPTPRSNARAAPSADLR